MCSLRHKGGSEPVDAAVRVAVEAEQSSRGARRPGKARGALGDEIPEGVLAEGQCEWRRHKPRDGHRGLEGTADGQLPGSLVRALVAAMEGTAAGRVVVGAPGLIVERRPVGRHHLQHQRPSETGRPVRVGEGIRQELQRNESTEDRSGNGLWYR